MKFGEKKNRLSKFYNTSSVRFGKFGSVRVRFGSVNISKVRVRFGSVNLGFGRSLTVEKIIDKVFYLYLIRFKTISCKNEQGLVQ